MSGPSTCPGFKICPKWICNWIDLLYSLSLTLMLSCQFRRLYTTKTVHPNRSFVFKKEEEKRRRSFFFKDSVISWYHYLPHSALWRYSWSFQSAKTKCKSCHIAVRIFHLFQEKLLSIRQYGSFFDNLKWISIILATTTPNLQDRMDSLWVNEMFLIWKHYKSKFVLLSKKIQVSEIHLCHVFMINYLC